ncbi:3369_t:CDS:2 [Entrophospora sp. SA101]|nr:3369_t:CDS:2 [Entrophospora sp. SA101]
MTCLKVGEHTILEACKHADMYGPEIEDILKKDIENIHLQKKLIEGLQTLKRYLQKDISKEFIVNPAGEALHNIEMAIKNTAGIHVANLEPNRVKGMIAGITNWNEWVWPDEGVEKGYIFARPLPGIGSWIKFSPQKIGNILKNYSIKKPNPKISQHTHSDKPWTMPFVEYKENPIEECDIEVEDQMIIDYEENLELDQSKRLIIDN